MCSYEDALAKALEDFRNGVPRTMAEGSGCGYDVDNNEFSLTYCGQEYRISYPDGEITAIQGYVTPEERVIFLQYLHFSRSIPPRRKWISFLELPGGEMHYAPFQRETFFPLARKYGSNLEEFKQRSKLVGEEAGIGDAAYIIPVFPRLELAIILWEKDAEYAARARVLFDATSSYHLPTATLYMLGIEVVKRIYDL
ncbi:MAG: DUF3786 domain-containing protein [Firmicutes bacterium]|jgi:hypothetical protein|nr:DUF3786 domain-containing protein [Bacillota bacterium]